MKCRYVNDWGDPCEDEALDFGWCPFHLKQMYGPVETGARTVKDDICKHGNRVGWHDGEQYHCDACDDAPSTQQVGGDHYKDMVIQPSEFIYKNKLNWLQGNSIKYICRHNRKHGAQDIDKAIHYLQLLKEWEYERDGSESD